ncbi:MAG: hypothetical protein OJF52_001889 [Nitrospira sp.]|jgi:hypothetical protein|nr:MAG: hypothetical protein OJF52_001889 [Nitrospira sp.]
MALNPVNPPIWLRNLHVTAAQISPDDYPATPKEGILQGCELSDLAHRVSAACRRAFNFGLFPKPLYWITHSTRISPHALGVTVCIAPPEDLILLKLRVGHPTDFEDALGIIKNPHVHLDLDYLWNWADRLGLQGELQYVLQVAASST